MLNSTLACWDNRGNHVRLEQMAHVPLSFISSLLPHLIVASVHSFKRWLMSRGRLAEPLGADTALPWPSASAVQPDTLDTDGHVLITTGVTFHNALTLLHGSVHILRHTHASFFFLDPGQVMLLFLHNPFCSHLSETCDRFEVISGSFKFPPPRVPCCQNGPKKKKKKKELSWDKHFYLLNLSIYLTVSLSRSPPLFLLCTELYTGGFIMLYITVAQIITIIIITALTQKQGSGTAFALRITLTLLFFVFFF